MILFQILNTIEIMTKMPEAIIGEDGIKNKSNQDENNEIWKNNDKPKEKNRRIRICGGRKVEISGTRDI